MDHNDITDLADRVELLEDRVAELERINRELAQIKARTKKQWDAMMERHKAEMAAMDAGEFDDGE